MGPLLQPVQIPLKGISSFFGINLTTQLGVVCRLAEGALNPIVYVTDEDSEKHRSQDRPLRDMWGIGLDDLSRSLPIPYIL